MSAEHQMARRNKGSQSWAARAAVRVYNARGASSSRIVHMLGIRHLIVAVSRATHGAFVHVSAAEQDEGFLSAARE